MKKKNLICSLAVSLCMHYFILFCPLRHCKKTLKTLVETHKKALLENKSWREHYSFHDFSL